MTTRQASRCGGQLRLTTAGEPVRISIRHCPACRQYTGSVFGTQARFTRAPVTIAGRAAEYLRTGDSGNPVAFPLCAACGSSVYWTLSALPEPITGATARGRPDQVRYPAALSRCHPGARRDP